MKQRNQNLRAWTALFAIYFIWGTTYLAGAFALSGFPPFTISAIRYLAAGLLLSLVLGIKEISFPQRKYWRVLAVSGILMLCGGSGLVIVGEQYISSGSAAVIMATEPLFFILLDRSRWREYFSNKRLIAGLVTGFAGLAFFTYFSPAGHPPVEPRPVLGTLITLISAVCWVVGALYAKRKVPAGAGNLSNSAIQLLAAGLFAALVAGIKGEWAGLNLQAIPFKAWAGIAYLVVMGSLVAFLAFNWLITVKPPAVVSTHTYVNPAVAILMGWLLAAEPVNALQLIALAVVLTGVLLSQSRRNAAT